MKTDTGGKERGEPMNYFDKNGNQIKAGMDIRMADGSFERVYETTDAYSCATVPCIKSSKLCVKSVMLGITMYEVRIPK